MAEGSCCLLAIEGEAMEGLKEWMVRSGHRADYALLCSRLKMCFDKKELWRKARAELV